MKKIQNNSFTDLIANILISLTLYMLFLGIFYFTYASKIENDIVKIQLGEFIGDLGNSIKNTDLNTDLRKIVSTLSSPDMSAEDRKVELNNKKIIIQFIIAFIIFAIISGIIIFILYRKYDLDIFNMVSTSLILLLFVGLTEIFFLQLVAKRYKSLDSNLTKKQILLNIKKFQNMN